MLILWPLLLPLAAASGWWWAKRGQNQAVLQQPPFLARDYIVGLNYLLNEQHDKAIDVFLKLLTVDNDTVETHLALGSLFRRRGEVDRAIRIHQNLTAREQLTNEQRAEAMLALGRDYLSAGMLDRAEVLLLELIQTRSEHSAQGLRYLLDVYQQEKSWINAIKIAEAITAHTGDDMRRVISHHYCELSEHALNQKNFVLSQSYLQKALGVDPNAVRASLLQGKIEMSQGSYQTAIQTYKRVREQAPDFLSEAIQPLGFCYEQLAGEAELIEYLKTVVQEVPRMSIVLYLAERLRNQHDVETAINFVVEFVRENPSLRGLKRLIEWHLASTYGVVHDKLQVLCDITQMLLEKKPIYRCWHCGFSGKQLHWQCPGCKCWETVKPIHGLEGD